MQESYPRQGAVAGLQALHKLSPATAGLFFLAFQGMNRHHSDANRQNEAFEKALRERCVSKLKQQLRLVCGAHSQPETNPMNDLAAPLQSTVNLEDQLQALGPGLR
jgi:hypothetical protein